jgi:hypothetical protein
MGETMPVFVGPNLRWPNARIPYEVQGIQPYLQRGIQEINKCLAYHIFVDRHPTDAAYMTVAHGGGNAQNIGYRGLQVHAITGGGEATIIHEALHVLGFLHEQYHRDYPWDDNVPVRPPVADFKTRDGMFSYQRRIAASAWNTALYAELVRPQAYKTSFGADFQLSCRHGARSDQAVSHHLHCDLDSVMMYSESRAAYLAVQGRIPPPGGGANVLASGKVGPLNILSTEDVAALRSIYPDPGRRCVKCGVVHGYWPSVINQWHRCPTCFAVYCPTCGSNLPGKVMLNPYRNCDRPGCTGRTGFA